MYYALTDKFVGDNPRSHTTGFANTKEVLAFYTKADRDNWLEETKLLSARPLNRTEALRYAGTFEGDKVARIYGRDYNSEQEQYHVLRKSRRSW